MRLFPSILLSVLLGALSFMPLAHAQAAAPSGVEMLRAALKEADNEVERNHKIREALPLLRREAIAGDAKAQYNLARLYETGIPSGPTATEVTFPARAYAWYTAAARQGHPLAQQRLAASGALTADTNNPAGTPSEKLTAHKPLSPEDKAAMGIGTSYQLVIASFRNRDNAAALVEILNEEGIIAMAHHQTDTASGDWHVVKSAPVFSRTGAEALRKGLRRNFGVDPQIKELDQAP